MAKDLIRLEEGRKSALKKLTPFAGCRKQKNIVNKPLHLGHGDAIQVPSLFQFPSVHACGRSWEK